GSAACPPPLPLRGAAPPPGPSVCPRWSAPLAGAFHLPGGSAACPPPLPLRGAAPPPGPSVCPRWSAPLAGAFHLPGGSAACPPPLPLRGRSEERRVESGHTLHWWGH